MSLDPHPPSKLLQEVQSLGESRQVAQGPAVEHGLQRPQPPPRGDAKKDVAGHEQVKPGGGSKNEV